MSFVHTHLWILSLFGILIWRVVNFLKFLQLWMLWVLCISIYEFWVLFFCSLSRFDLKDLIFWNICGSGYSFYAFSFMKFELLWLFLFNFLEFFAALNPSESIGSNGGRNFVMCKKQKQPQMTEARSEMIARKGTGSWKAWIHKSFAFKISSH